MGRRESSRQGVKNFENNREELGLTTQGMCLEQVEAGLLGPEWPLRFSSPKQPVSGLTLSSLLGSSGGLGKGKVRNRPEECCSGMGSREFLPDLHPVSWPSTPGLIRSLFPSSK